MPIKPDTSDFIILLQAIGLPWTSNARRSQSSLGQFLNLLDILVALTLPDNGTNRTG
jgi:hypothetical protein